METQPYALASRESPASLERCDDSPAIGQIRKFVTHGWVRLERQNLAANSKASNAVCSAELDCRGERFGVGRAQAGKPGCPIGRQEAQERCRGRGSEFDRLFAKLTYQS
jgi:hypothetical protein